MRKMCGFSLIELMIALSLGTLLCIGIFNLFMTMKNLQVRQMVLSHAQEKMRFMSQFVRTKIQMAGNWSCLSQAKPSRSIVIHKYDANQAMDKLGLTIKPKTDLLQLHECIRLHDQQQYLPIEFFVADTFRQNNNKKDIDALFFKIAHHPREEMITDMTYFHVQLYRARRSKKKYRAVKISYTFSSENDAAFSQNGILYAAVR